MGVIIWIVLAIASFIFGVIPLWDAGFELFSVGLGVFTIMSAGLFEYFEDFGSRNVGKPK